MNTKNSGDEISEKMRDDNARTKESISFPPFSAAKQAKPIHEDALPEKLGNDNPIRQAIPDEQSEVFKKALILCVEKRRASISVLQQGLGIGYENALVLLDKMTEQGFLGEARGERPRPLMNLAFETIGLWKAQKEIEIEAGIKEIKRDGKYDEAVRIVVEMGRASTSVLQRRLRIGYGQAASIIDTMYREGIVGPEDGSKPRKVLVKADFLERLHQVGNEDEPW
jgi:DNA segregation ATPase FtsK/SpoIIIE-like protein